MGVSAHKGECTPQFWHQGLVNIARCPRHRRDGTCSRLEDESAVRAFLVLRRHVSAEARALKHSSSGSSLDAYYLHTRLLTNYAFPISLNMSNSLYISNQVHFSKYVE